LASQPELELLDLSRNNIANIAPGTFLGLGQLRELDLSVNALRTVSSSAIPLMAVQTKSGYGLKYLQQMSRTGNRGFHWWRIRFNPNPFQGH
jgi:Leucine-rich repeat (LRR) protein